MFKSKVVKEASRCDIKIVCFEKLGIQLGKPKEEQKQHAYNKPCPHHVKRKLLLFLREEKEGKLRTLSNDSLREKILKLFSSSNDSTNLVPGSFSVLLVTSGASPA